MQLPHNWAIRPPEIAFFPHGSGTLIFVTKLVKEFWVQIDNVFSPSAQSTDAVNKTRLLIFMKRRSFQDLLQSFVIPLYGALVLLHLEYGMSARSPKPRGRYQPFGVNLKISNTIGNWHSSLSLRRETAVAMPLFLVAATTSN